MADEGQQSVWGIFVTLLQQILQLLSSLVESFQAKASKKSYSVDSPVYGGKKSEDVDTWLLKMENALESRGYSDLDSRFVIPYVVGHLDGGALRWYSSHVKNAGKFSSWNELRIAISDQFTNPYRQQILRSNLKNLKQISSITDYISEFRGIINQINEMNEIDKIHYFTDGLRKKARQEVQFRLPKTIEEAIAIAGRVESAFFPEVLLDECEPMEIDYAKARKLPYKFKCFKCGGIGHKANVCPSGN